MQSDNKAYEITWLIRRLFRAMGQWAESYLADAGVSAADRAVMEFLYADKKLSVPQIADRYDVSRQHVQVTANGLLNSGLLRSEENPRHKRSPLLRLSELGRSTFAEIRHNETRLIDRLFDGIASDALSVTCDTLKILHDRLK